MKKSILTLTCLLLTMLFCACTSEYFAQGKPKHRKIALQCYTFKEFTLEETLKMTKHLNFDGLEATTAQKISDKRPVKISPDMGDEDKLFLKNLLKEYGQKFVSFGVVGARNEEDVEKYCKFAKEFGMEAVLTEDRVSMFPIWQKIGEKYGIKMYVHHHSDTSPNQYFDPYVMMRFVSKYSNIMANPDNGHWSRCSINSVEGFSALKGEIGSIHLKDQKTFGDPANCQAPYGEGELELKKVLRELDSQNYNGYFVIEYESDWKNPLPNVEKCVKFLRNN